MGAWNFCVYTQDVAGHQTPPAKPREKREMESETLIEAAIRVLNTSDPNEKARLGDSIAVKWLQGSITEAYDPTVDLPVPDRPARLTNVPSPSISSSISYICEMNWVFDKTVGEIGVSEFDAEAGKSR